MCNARSSLAACPPIAYKEAAPPACRGGASTGAKLTRAAEMLQLLPQADVKVIERCSGHGGSWGFKKDNFETALKVGKPVARQARDAAKGFVTSECPLAGVHISQGIEKLGGEAARPELVRPPIQILARAYGL